MDWTPILTYLATLAPWVGYLFAGLGVITVIGTAIDQLIPDEKDHGFMKKVMNIPVLGTLIESLQKFSPFNFKDKL